MMCLATLTLTAVAKNSQKKGGLLRTINIEFADAKADKLYGDVYSREDVEDFCEFLATAVKVSVARHIIYM